jgi:hypothetical protein
MAPTLDTRAARIKAATTALYGERGQSRMADSIGISRQLLNFIIAGKRPVTDAVERKVADALYREAARLRQTAMRLDTIAGLILRKLEN